MAVTQDVQFGMMGVTYRRLSQQALERYAYGDTPADAAQLVALHQVCGFTESVLIATCNRVEIIFAAQRDVSVAERRRRMWLHYHPEGVSLPLAEQMAAAAALFVAYEGEGAIERLLLITASLDSMQPGEAQILGQVKQALRIAKQRQLVGPWLTMIFEEAFHAAKRVRSQTRLGEGNVSLLSLAEGKIRERLQLAHHEQHREAYLVIVGAGEMAQQCAHLVADMPAVRLRFVNRTLARAAALARKYSGVAVDLEEFLRDPGRCDVLLSATAAPAHLLAEPVLQLLQAQQPLLIDLAVQRDISPQACVQLGLVCIAIDDLQAAAQVEAERRRQELAEARLLLDESLVACRRRLEGKAVAPLLRTLRHTWESTLEQALLELFASLAMTPAEQQLMRVWSKELLQRLAHAPTEGIRQVAMEAGTSALAPFSATLEKGDRAERSSNNKK